MQDSKIEIQCHICSLQCLSSYFQIVHIFFLQLNRCFKPKCSNFIEKLTRQIPTDVQKFQIHSIVADSVFPCHSNHSQNIIASDFGCIIRINCLIEAHNTSTIPKKLVQFHQVLSVAMNNRKRHSNIDPFRITNFTLIAIIRISLAAVSSHRYVSKVLFSPNSMRFDIKVKTYP